MPFVVKNVVNVTISFFCPFFLTSALMISKKQAMCMFYYAEYTEENILKYEERLKEVEQVDGLLLRYNKTEEEPILTHRNRILGNPMTYRRYPEEAVEVTNKVKRDIVELVTKEQTLQFINEVFKTEKSNSNLETLSTSNVFEIVKQYTTVFGPTATQGFANWCRNQKVEFLKAKEKRQPMVSREM
jgi:hypothetical protein